MQLLSFCLKVLTILCVSLSVSSYFLPSTLKSVDKLRYNKFLYNVDKYVLVQHYSNIEDSFHEAILSLPETKGVVILEFKKLDKKLIEYICDEFKDVYDFSEAVFTRKYFIWRKTLS